MLRSAAWQQVVCGRTPLRYHFEVVPHAVEGLPVGVEAVSVVWEKGSKLSYTDPAPVDAVTHTAKFREVMRQSATLYREGSRFLPKDYKIKVQSVPAASADAGGDHGPDGGAKPHAATPPGSAGRRTLGRATLDLAQYASSAAQPESHRVSLPLEGCAGGKCVLHLTVRATWLKHLASAGAGTATSHGPDAGSLASDALAAGGGDGLGGHRASPRISTHSSIGDGRSAASSDDGAVLFAAAAPGGGGAAGAAAAAAAAAGPPAGTGADAAAAGGAAGGGKPESGDYHSRAAFMDVLLGLQSGDGGRPKSASAVVAARMEPGGGGGRSSATPERPGLGAWARPPYLRSASATPALAPMPEPASEGGQGSSSGGGGAGAAATSGSGDGAVSNTASGPRADSGVEAAAGASWAGGRVASVRQRFTNGPAAEQPTAHPLRGGPGHALGSASFSGAIGSQHGSTAGSAGRGGGEGAGGADDAGGAGQAPAAGNGPGAPDAGRPHVGRSLLGAVVGAGSGRAAAAGSADKPPPSPPSLRLSPVPPRSPRTDAAPAQPKQQHRQPAAGIPAAGLPSPVADAPVYTYSDAVRLSTGSGAAGGPWELQAAAASVLLNDAAGDDAGGGDSSSDNGAHKPGQSGPLPSEGSAGVGRAPSGSVPAWMAQGRGAARGASTEELMHEISTTRDMAGLQRLARGLLAERNDFRFQAGLWEGNARALEEEADKLRAKAAGLAERVAALEEQLAELRRDDLVDALVGAKLAAAQRDLEAAELRGVLAQERDRARGLAAKLTALQDRYELLINKSAATAVRVPSGPPMQLHRWAAAEGAAQVGASAAGGGGGAGAGAGAADAPPARAARISSGSDQDSPYSSIPARVASYLAHAQRR